LNVICSFNPTKFLISICMQDGCVLEPSSNASSLVMSVNVAMLVFVDISLHRSINSRELLSGWNGSGTAINSDSDFLFDNDNLLDSSISQGGVRCGDGVRVLWLDLVLVGERDVAREECWLSGLSRRWTDGGLVGGWSG